MIHLRAPSASFGWAAARAVVFLVALAATLIVGGAAAQPSADALSGTWRGSLDPDGVALGIVLHVEITPAGLAITMDVPPQGAFGLPVETVRSGPGGELVLRAPTLPAAPVFDGTVDGDRYAGTFTQGPAELTFVLEKSLDEAGPDPDRPQIPRPPFPYATRDRTVQGPVGALAGTLVLPEGPGPHPLVVLVNGSGAQDRDGTVLGHPTMAVLADRLARAGIGSFRWDDRGVGGSEGDLREAGVDGLVADVTAVINALAEDPGVDAARIALVGHSEGGLVVPRAAAGDAPVAAVVLLAAPAVSGLHLLLEQNRLILVQGGASEADIEEQFVYLRALEAALREGDGEAARALTRARVEVQLDALPEGAAPTGEARTAYVDAQVENTASPTFADLVLADPQPSLRALTVPTLALFFGLDVQVSAEQNAEPMRAALDAAGVAHRAVVLDGLNHLMQPAESGGLEEYAAIPTTVDEEVLALLTSWLRETLAVGP